MTLEEYLNQKDPVKMPNVWLTEQDYDKVHKIKLPNGDTLTQILIKGIDFIYLQKNNLSHLYTQDGDGNIKAISCFNIEKTIQLQNK